MLGEASPLNLKAHLHEIRHVESSAIPFRLVRDKSVADLEGRNRRPPIFF